MEINTAGTSSVPVSGLSQTYLPIQIIAIDCLFYLFVSCFFFLIANHFNPFLTSPLPSQAGALLPSIRPLHPLPPVRSGGTRGYVGVRLPMGMAAAKATAVQGCRRA